MAGDETQPGVSAELSSRASSPPVAVPAQGQLSNAEIHPRAKRQRFPKPGCRWH